MYIPSTSEIVLIVDVEFVARLTPRTDPLPKAVRPSFHDNATTMNTVGNLVFNA
jgi:hypothetical protein